MNSQKQIYYVVGAVVIGVLAIFLIFSDGNKTSDNGTDNQNGSENVADRENVATLTSETDTNIISDANRSFEGGMFTFGLRAQNLPDPGAGKFYEVFLRKAGEDTISLGKMEKSTSGESAASYVFGYQVREDLLDYNDIIVTLEQNDDQTPETIVLSGRFQ